MCARAAADSQSEPSHSPSATRPPEAFRPPLCGFRTERPITQTKSATCRRRDSEKVCRNGATHETHPPVGSADGLCHRSARMGSAGRARQAPRRGGRAAGHDAACRASTRSRRRLKARHGGARGRGQDAAGLGELGSRDAAGKVNISGYSNFRFRTKSRRRRARFSSITWADSRQAARPIQFPRRARVPERAASRGIGRRIEEPRASEGG